ncbi:RecX family transcriptional regulator [bacterium]|nr:RecX family transcriptional regulator [bacterium]
MPRITRIIPRRQGSWLELLCAGGGGIAQTPGTGLRLPFDKLPAWASAGSEISFEQYRELEQLSDYELLLDRALRLLGRREHFTAELRDKLGQPRLSLRQREALAREGLGPADAATAAPEAAGPGSAAPAQPMRRASRELLERVLGYCRSEGFVDDRRAAVYLITLLAMRADTGRRKVREELLRRGCAAALADELLEEHASEFDDKAAMEELLRRRRRSLEGRARRLREKLQKQIDAQEAADSSPAADELDHTEGSGDLAEADRMEHQGAGSKPDAEDSADEKPVKRKWSARTMKKPRKDERWLRFELKGRLSAAVFSLLASRGFGGDDARRAAQRTVDELLDL